MIAATSLTQPPKNSIVNAIIIQIEESQEADKKELTAFLKTISQSTQPSPVIRRRNMIDKKVRLLL
jgi:Cft2 family RNA processing exonuclease